MKNFFYILGITLFFIGCKSEQLNGHYHLIWNKEGKQFQTWNIRNNRMKINESVCFNPDSCFASRISFKGDMITVNPWVDFEFSAKYKKDKNGTIIILNHDNDTLWLVPNTNCITSKEYLKNKTKQLTDSINLLSDVMTGSSEFPQNYENELIILNSKDRPLYVFNDEVIQKLKSGDFGIKNVDNESVWLYVDNRVTVQNVLPIVNELFKKGYKVQYSTAQERENKEQIQLLTRNIKKIKTSKNKFEIDYCEFCDKYENNKIDSIITIKMLEVDKYIMNGKEDDLFQIRNRLVRYIIKNKTTRLNTQILIDINGNTSFSDYLTLVDELNWVHEETDMTTYKGENDPDAEWIRSIQWSRDKSEILFEFPIRIKEKISMSN